ncbi:lipopolysaccharide heptosyltransferase I [Aquabacterium sp.]|uniref:lipopolysaccharide heptosyltransferase I n=1 Tax=Aquabacterium sp. TaxID=1872578 RepID=UPI0025C135EA|nr:lipopolysaccharide heptosyltransferase I [Aquabacterium sp.]
MRVLIVKTSSMGDVVHALPAISDMARAIPGVQIDWVVEKGFSAMPAQHRAVQRVIPLQWRKWRKSLRSAETRAALAHWRAEMRRERYDLVIDLQGLLKSALFACFANGPRAGYDRHSIREPLASFFYGRTGHVSRELHAVDRCRALAAQLLGYRHCLLAVGMPHQYQHFAVERLLHALFGLQFQGIRRVARHQFHQVGRQRGTVAPLPASQGQHGHQQDQEQAR